MDVAIALHAAAAVLLMIAGLAKISRPSSSADLLFALGLRRVGPDGLTGVAVVLGLTELSVGTTALVVGGPVVAFLVGAFYVGFVAAVLRALAVGAGSCGCFGRADAPPSWLHVVGNTVLAAVSFAAVGAATPLDVMGAQPAAGVGFVVLVGVLAGLALVLFTALPEALAAREPRYGS